MEYHLLPVNTKEEIAQFHRVPFNIYQEDPVWVSPLEMEVESVFDPSKNKFFEGGEAQRWVLKDEKQQLVGRVAAFFNQKTAQSAQIPLGGMGFFECIDDKQAAFQLFDIAIEWLKTKGMEAVEAPINFGDNDKNWGLLVHGYSHPSYGMNYNPSYYQGYFENYGFKVYYEQVSKHLDLNVAFPPRMRKIAEWVAQKENVRFDHARKKKLMKYGLDFMEIFNEAWKHHENFTEMKEEDVTQLINMLKHVIIERFMIFAYVKEEPAGFLFCLPDLNQIFKPLKGKFSFIQQLLFKWRSRNDFAWYRNKGILDRGRVMIIGVKPKFQKIGIESGMTLYSMDDAKAMGFKEIELSWVGDFNPMSRKLQDATQAKLAKIHNTYRLAFDPDFEWPRREKLKADVRGEVGE